MDATENAHTPAVLNGSELAGSTRLVRADQVVLCADIARICR
jgi:hypothetical protein